MATSTTGDRHSRASLLERARVLFRRHTGASVLCFGFILFHISYCLVLAVVRPDLTRSQMLLGAFNNAVSAVLIAAALMAILRRFVMGKPLSVHGLVHLMLAPACMLTWYAAVIIGIGIRNGSLGTGFNVAPFPAGALVWQTFQGFFVYTAAAAVSYAIHFAQENARLRASLRALDTRVAESATDETRPSRILVKDGAELRTIDLDDIVAVRARDDTVEILTGPRNYTARSTLTQFATRLPETFIRVHRSSVVNLNMIHSAEPAGDGRLSLHLTGGHTLTTSRAGARLIRDRIS